jgi:hypothetical protein
MNSPDRLHRPFGALLAVEFRTVGMAIAREGLLALAAFLAVCVLTAVTAIRSDDRLEVGPELLLPVLPLSLILPWLVWKGDPVFGRALLWTLPVRRQRAAAAKVAAGALWLMLGVLLTFAGLALTTLASGGKFGCEEVRFLAPPSGGPVGAERVQWTTPVWAWLMPFGGALLAYTAGSAVLLGLRHPLRWLAGAASTLVLLGVLAVNLGPDSAFTSSIDRLLTLVVNGTYGLDFALAGGEHSLVYDVDRHGQQVGDRRAVLWRDMPSFERWAAALLVWMSAMLLALALAIRRHWER